MDESKFREEQEKIVKGLELTYKRLIAFKKSKNSPLVVSKNGQVIEVDPKKAAATTKYKWY